MIGISVLLSKLAKWLRNYKIYSYIVTLGRVRFKSFAMSVFMRNYYYPMKIEDIFTTLNFMDVLYLCKVNQTL